MGGKLGLASQASVRLRCCLRPALAAARLNPRARACLQARAANARRSAQTHLKQV